MMALDERVCERPATQKTSIAANHQNSEVQRYCESRLWQTRRRKLVKNLKRLRKLV